MSSSRRGEQVNYSRLQPRHSKTGIKMEKSNPSELQEDIVDSPLQTSEPLCKQNKSQSPKQKSVTVESQPLLKKKIWKDRLNSSEQPIQPTELLKILDQALTSKEKAFKPFWTLQSQEISQKLWLPTEIDCVDSVLSSSKESYQNTPMGKSWFSINQKRPQNPNLQPTSFQSLQFSLPDSTASAIIPSVKKSEKQLKTMKFRLLPTPEEKAYLQIQMEKFRWFYDSSLTVLNLEAIRTGKKLEDNHSFSYPFLRDYIVKKYRYTEEQVDHMVFCDYVYDDENAEMMCPEWMTGIHSRLQRGAIQKLSENINSALSNKRAGNIGNFNLKMLSKKSPTEFIHFEDKSFPVAIKEIDSRFWFTDKSRKRQSISFKDVFNNTTKKGIEIIHDKTTDTYSLHYPVDVDYFPTTDRRGDNQARYEVAEENRFISLDPGVRKFMVGYDPKGKCVIFGEGANKELSSLLYKIDASEDSQMRNRLFRRIHNLVEELHWKTITYLITNYDTIILPDFRISGMVKGKKLAKITKRLLYMFSFNSFRQKLEWKCRIYNKKLVIVDESYTSKTCGGCGVLNNVGSSEKYTCKKCGFNCDRDVNGSRNIMIKNLTLRLIPDFPVSK